MAKISQNSTATNVIVASTSITQNRSDSWCATVPLGFNSAGEPHAAKRSEDKMTSEAIWAGRFIPRNKGILTSHLLTNVDDGNAFPHKICDTLSIIWL